MEVINNLIYFNNNATTAMDARVAEVMQEAEGSDPVKALTEAATAIAHVIGSQPSEVFFTGGVTASIHLAIHSLFDAYSHKGKHCITSVTEHAETLNAFDRLKEQGAAVTYLPVDKEGLIDVDALEAAITNDTIFVSIIAANNHTGVVQPIEKITEICQKYNVVLFSDASQFVGKLRCDVTELGMECMAFGSHKMHGPKGIGALYVKEGTALHKSITAWSK